MIGSFGTVGHSVGGAIDLGGEELGELGEGGWLIAGEGGSRAGAGRRSKGVELRLQRGEPCGELLVGELGRATTLTRRVSLQALPGEAQLLPRFPFPSRHFKSSERLSSVYSFFYYYYYFLFFFYFFFVRTHFCVCDSPELAFFLCERNLRSP
jgi:hypothetical protein